MENEGSRLAGVEEGYKGDQGPSWTVVPVNEWKWMYQWYESVK
jgi:hypothetical protein